jgi:16S rRNA (uracil1498-N3)-methyltransferase
VLPRFLAPDLDPARGGVALPPDEARHLSRVLRLGPGAEVEVFDGRGRAFVAQVAAVTRDAATLRLVRPLASPPAPAVPFACAQAILKGTGMDAVVRDATMLGADAVVPLVSAHVAVRAEAIAKGRPAERWRRVALASAKQCRRATLPDVADPQRFDQWIRAVPADLRLLFVEPSAAPAGTRAIRAWLGRARPASAVLAVGPEGGWSDREIEAALAAGFEPVTLGPLTLRADAVAIAAIAMFRMLWDEGPAPASPPLPPTR